MSLKSHLKEFLASDDFRRSRKIAKVRAQRLPALKAQIDAYLRGETPLARFKDDVVAAMQEEVAIDGLRTPVWGFGGPGTAQFVDALHRAGAGAGAAARLDKEQKKALAGVDPRVSAEPLRGFCAFVARLAKEQGAAADPRLNVGNAICYASFLWHVAFAAEVPVFYGPSHKGVKALMGEGSVEDAAYTSRDVGERFQAFERIVASLRELLLKVNRQLNYWAVESFLEWVAARLGAVAGDASIQAAAGASMASPALLAEGFSLPPEPPASPPTAIRPAIEPGEASGPRTQHEPMPAITNISIQVPKAPRPEPTVKLPDESQSRREKRRGPAIVPASAPPAPAPAAAQSAPPAAPAPMRASADDVDPADHALEDRPWYSGGLASSEHAPPPPPPAFEPALDAGSIQDSPLVAAGHMNLGKLGGAGRRGTHPEIPVPPPAAEAARPPARGPDEVRATLIRPAFTPAKKPAAPAPPAAPPPAPPPAFAEPALHESDARSITSLGVPAFVLEDDERPAPRPPVLPLDPVLMGLTDSVAVRAFSAAFDAAAADDRPLPVSRPPEAPAKSPAAVLAPAPEPEPASAASAGVERAEPRPAAVPPPPAASIPEAPRPEPIPEPEPVSIAPPVREPAAAAPAAAAPEPEPPEPEPPEPEPAPAVSEPARLAPEPAPVLAAAEPPAPATVEPAPIRAAAPAPADGAQAPAPAAPSTQPTPTPTPTPAPAPRPARVAALERDIAALAAETCFDEPLLEELDHLLRAKHQVLLCGPTGTGKTHLARRFALHFAGAPERVRFVQLHRAYRYEEFVEGPPPAGSSTASTGVFKTFAGRAARDLGNTYVLVLDEVGRADLITVLGECFSLLEYRDEEVQLPYSRESFRLPPNLYLVGTVTTGGPGRPLDDLALRRRFHFLPVDPCPRVLERWLAANSPGSVWVAWLFEALNLKLARDLGPQRRLGQSIFMEPSLDERGLERLWRYSLRPLLESIFAHDPSKLDGYALEVLVGEARKMAAAATAPPETADEPVGAAAGGSS